MTAGYIDPKPSGNFSEEELLRSTHLNAILQSLRHQALSQFLTWTEGVVNNEGIGDDIVDWYSETGGVSSSQLHATPDSSATVIKLSSGQSPPTMNDSSHAQTSSDINNITRVTAKPESRVWFGLDKDAASSVGYLSLTAAGTWARINRAAGASTDAAAVTAMAYSPELQMVVACWNDQDIEYCLNATTWISAGNPGDVISQLLWGETAFVGARLGTAKTAGYTSVDGINWVNAPFGMALPGSTHIAHDFSTDTWYALGSDFSSELVIVTTQSPASSWAQIPAVTDPCFASGGISSFVVAGGIMGLMTAQGLLCVSPDLGQTWTVMGQFGSGAIIRKAGGRLFVLNNASIFVSPCFFPPFTPTD